MDDEYYEEKLKRTLTELGIRFEHLVFERSCASVADAARTAGAAPDEFIKSVCLRGKDNTLLVAIVRGADRIDLDRVGTVLGVRRPRLAGPTWAQEMSGYPAGGTPPLGFEARFVVDGRVLDLDLVYSGGGSSRSLLRMRPTNIVAATGALVDDIAQHDDDGRRSKVEGRRSTTESSSGS
jgi:prolyl-tRNA editing enzyme YbaK/EbsC (Cys-tRNA(Pro) deacylase)